MKISDDFDLNLVEALRTVGDWVRWGCSQLGANDVFFGHGTDNPADEARALVFAALALDHEVPDYFYHSRLTEAERAGVLDLFRRRIQDRVPLPYLTGEAWFAGLRFKVDERVLIPRSPIAEMVQHGFEPWLPMAEPGRVLDLCTGSGCIAIACAYAFLEAEIVASDINPEALEVARENVQRHGLESRVTVLHSDLYAGLGEQTFDLIVTNPPYVPASSMALLPAEYLHEPSDALEADENGLKLVKAIVRDAARYLTADGVLVVEVGESRDATAEALSGLPLSWVEFDMGGDGVFVLSALDLKNAADF
ncbi:MAG: 50S ribosomal protein L3 N(5)-glutamine methyltransferase [Gammaproteobacteria bacterium]